MKELTQEILKELLHYDPDTGVFTWKKRDRKWFKSDRDFKSWNARYPQEKAGCVKDGYTAIRLAGKANSAHRLAWLFVYGVTPVSQIDHINHNKSDNRILNLREATPQSNQRNMPKSPRNKSGTTGVRLDTRSNRWTAQIRYDGEQVHLGSYIEMKDAIKARKAAERIHGYHKNHGL